MLKKLQFDQGAGIWKGSLEGELDVFQAPKMLESLEQALSAHPATIVLDCEKLDYIDSMGLGALVKANKHAQNTGGRVTLENVKPRIHKLFAITGLCGVFGMEEASHEG